MQKWVQPDLALSLGYGSGAHQLSRNKAKNKQYCKRLATRKEAAQAKVDPSVGSKDQQCKEAVQKPDEEKLLQLKSSHPPPPPPSPLVSESSSLELT